MSYPLTQYQSYLLSNNTISTSHLSTLYRNSLTRLQFFLFHKRNYIKSTPDQFSYLRIIFLTILTKIFTTHSFNNNNNNNIQLLTKFKEIIYQSKLTQIINNKGLQKEILHKVVAEQLKKLIIRVESQSQLIYMFNCVAFFDEIVVKAVKQSVEKFMKDKQKIQRNQSQKNSNIVNNGYITVLSIDIIEKYLIEIFDLRIKWDNNNNNNNNEQNQHQDEHQPFSQQFCSQNSNSISLYRFPPPQLTILKQSISNMTYIVETSESQSIQNTSIRASDQKQNKQQRSHLKMFKTISVDESKSPFQYGTKNRISSDQNITGFENIIYRNDDDNDKKKIMLINKSNKENINKNKRSLWDMLCCRSNQ